MFMYKKLFEQIEQGHSHKLKNLLPSLNTFSFIDSLRTVRKYRLPLIKTDRFKNSFILIYIVKQRK